VKNFGGRNISSLLPLFERGLMKRLLYIIASILLISFWSFTSCSIYRGQGNKSAVEKSQEFKDKKQREDKKGKENKSDIENHDQDEEEEDFGC